MFYYSCCFNLTFYGPSKRLKLISSKCKRKGEVEEEKIWKNIHPISDIRYKWKLKTLKGNNAPPFFFFLIKEEVIFFYIKKKKKKKREKIVFGTGIPIFKFSFLRESPIHHQIIHSIDGSLKILEETGLILNIFL